MTLKQLPTLLSLEDARIIALELGCSHEINWTIPDMDKGPDIPVCHYFGSLDGKGNFWELFHLGLHQEGNLRSVTNFRKLNQGKGREWHESMVPGVFSTLSNLEL